MELSVVIPCRGQAQLLTACIRSVTQQRTDFDFEVIVVDSGGRDEEVAQAVRAFDRVKLVQSERPLVAGPARNLGVHHASGRFLAFTDADCIVEPGWLQAARDALCDERIRIVGGPVLDALRKKWIASVDNLLQFVDLPATRPRGPARYFPTCNLAMRRKDFQQLGGFIDTNTGGAEDILLCEATLSRWPGSLLFEPAMAVRHTGRTTWQAYLAHHHMFGWCRARYALHVKPWHLRWGKHTSMIPLLTFKRLIYLLQSGIRYRGWRAWPLFVQLPLIVPGLWYSAVGFCQGCRESERK